MDQLNNSQSLSDHYDVLIIGAGISGIDAAYHLQKLRPDTRFAMIERMPSFGGTWRTHNFPGIRSDSDLFTFGFKWKPWTGIPIATADQILTYLDAALDENDLRRHIRFNTDVLSAAWSSDAQHWTVRLRRGGDETPVTITCNFLWMCSVYYNHTDAYTPDWPGMEREARCYRIPCDVALEIVRLRVICSKLRRASSARMRRKSEALLPSPTPPEQIGEDWLQ